MLEVGTNSSPLDTNLIHKVKKSHGLELPTVYVPQEIHREFLSTTSKAFRTLLAETISKDDVVGTFKLTILGANLRYKLKSTKNFKNFQDNWPSKSRLAIYEDSYPEHSIKMVQTWFDVLQGKEVMTNTDLTTVTTWINEQRYNDQNDPHRNQVSDLLE